METSRPNPYEHLSVEELMALRYEKQTRYEQLQDQYYCAHADWILVMNALKGVMSGERQQRPEQTGELSA